MQCLREIVCEDVCLWVLWCLGILGMDVSAFGSKRTCLFVKIWGKMYVQTETWSVTRVTNVRKYLEISS